MAVAAELRAAGLMSPEEYRLRLVELAEVEGEGRARPRG